MIPCNSVNNAGRCARKIIKRKQALYAASPILKENNFNREKFCRVEAGN